MPHPGLEVLTGILATSVTPMNTPPSTPTDPGVLAVDEDASIRLFHERAFFASAGVAMDLFPVELDSGARVLLSSVTSSPDAPMIAGQGWVFLRDGEGGAAVVLVNDSTTLEDVRDAIVAAELAVAPVVVQDAGGFRLMVVLDETAAMEMREGAVHYGPAESVSSPATVKFGQGRVMGFPFSEFAAVDGDLVALDLGWGNSSADNGPLTIDTEDVRALQSTTRLGSGGWESFDRYATMSREGVSPMLIQEVPVTVDGLGSLQGTSSRAVPVREARWMAQVGGNWEPAEGNVRSAFDTFRELEPGDYRIFLIE